jgi:hypothetical protein
VNKLLVKDGLGWGLVLWLIGYVLGMVLFMIVQPALVGWVIMPIGTAITVWVLVKKIKAGSFGYYVMVGAIWTVIAIIFDYLFLVRMLNPADGYYKLDVYVYYASTLGLPLLVGWYKWKK